MPDDDINVEYFDDLGRLIWRCRYCPYSYALSGGVGHAAKHLTGPDNLSPFPGHGMIKESPRGVEVKRKQQSLEQSIGIALAHKAKRRRQGEPGGDSVDPDILEHKYVKFLVVTNQSFRLCSSNKFRDLLSFLNNDIDQWLLRSNYTIRECVLRQYEYYKEPVRTTLGLARSKIYISCDLWTSNNHLAILGVIAHYVSEEGFLCSKVLVMKSIVRGYTTED